MSSTAADQIVIEPVAIRAWTENKISAANEDEEPRALGVEPPVLAQNAILTFSPFGDIVRRRGGLYAGFNR